MKATARTLALLLGINFIFGILPQPAGARFAQAQTRQVPIARLLRNLEYQKPSTVNSTDKAMIEFRIGRLHAMAYAQNADEAPCDKAAAPGSKYEIPDFGHQPDHVQFQVNNPNKNSAKAKEHLAKAIEHLQNAARIDPSLDIVKLGLAWCLEQSGEKTKALSLYRDVFKHTAEGDKSSKGGMYNWSIAEETATYLKPLLDPARDKKEIEQINADVKQIGKLPHYVTPLMIPIADGFPFNQLIVNRPAKYDLDGFGTRTYTQWISPNAAWLVLNSDGKGQIDSGIKLIGQSSFWIFWNNAYEVLRGLDDNHDGKLSGKELEGLALWRDMNSNCVSDPGEVLPLSTFNIEALSVSATRNNEGILWNHHGVFLKNGKYLPSFDVILSDKQGASQSPPNIPHGAPALPAVR